MCIRDSRIINLRFLYWGKSNSPVPLIASFLTDLEDFLNVKDFEVVVQEHHFVMLRHCYGAPCLEYSVVVYNCDRMKSENQERRLRGNRYI